MALSRKQAADTFIAYAKAWETQNPDLAASLFTEDATYHERVLQAPIGPGREAIREYWQSKVVESQANIVCKLMTLYIDGDTAISEWVAEFDDTKQGVRKRMREIAVLVFKDGLISSLREYWASEDVGRI